MPSYQVTRTPAGGYWIRQADGIDLAAGAVGAAAGTALGTGINAVRRHRAQVNYKNYNAAFDALMAAMQGDDRDYVVELANEFIRHYPHDENGYIGLLDGIRENPRISPQEELRLANAAGAHVEEPMYASITRCDAYLRLEDMGHLMQEANVVVSMGDPQLAAVGLRYRAQALLWLGDLNQAMNDANTSLSRLPKPSTYALRGDIYWALGNTDQAISEYSMAIALDPDYGRWYDQRASALESVGRTSEAAADRERSRLSGWEPTHTVPHPGMNAWESPDPEAPPVTALSPGVELRVVEVLGAWARVDAKNGWTAWVDNRILRPASR